MPVQAKNFFLFRTFNEDGSVKNPGIKFRQSFDAPTDVVLINPAVLQQLLATTAVNGLIDVYIASE
jgi:hypothetical protein